MARLSVQFSCSLEIGRCLVRGARSREVAILLILGVKHSAFLRVGGGFGGIACEPRSTSASSFTRLQIRALRMASEVQLSSSFRTNLFFCKIVARPLRRSVSARCASRTFLFKAPLFSALAPRLKLLRPGCRLPSPKLRGSAFLSQSWARIQTYRTGWKIIELEQDLPNECSTNGSSVMSSGFKVDLINYDIEDSSMKDKSTVNKNAVYRILHTFMKQRNSLFIKPFADVANRITTTRLSKRNQAAAACDLDENGKRQETFGRNSGPLLSGIAYCISSCSMILLNKVALSTYGFSAGISLMLYQNFICVVTILALRLMGVVSTERLTWKLIQVWLPVNVIFVCMLVTGMYSLQYINVAMVTILKNMTNILTAIGEVYLFRKHQNRQEWAAILLMIVSAICGGITDLSFHAVGYTWQAINCFMTASYSLALRSVIDKAKQLSESGSLSELSLVLLNNLLSIPLAVFLIILFNEWEYVYKTEVIQIPMFWVVATASGLLGLAISFTSIWFLNQTGPTTYSLVGSLNKIPISLAGIMLFKVPVNIPNFFSILFGLFAGVFFAKAKMSK